MTIAGGTVTARPATAPTTSCRSSQGPSLTVPVIDGRLALGTWQSIALLDPNADNPERTVLLSFLAG